MSESLECASNEEIFELRRGRWHAAGDFVTADAGKHNAISLRSHARCELLAGFVGAAARTRSGRKVVAVEFEREWLLLTDIDVAAGAAALLFDLGEIGSLVPVGFGVVGV